MPGARPNRFGERSPVDFVPDWEDLPDGEWLENDEHGVHWYATTDGAYWHSTEDGYRLWVDDDEASEDPIDQTTNRLENDEEDDAEAEDDANSGPAPRLGAGTGVLSISVALFVLAWTLFITVQSAEYNMEMYTSATPALGQEMDQAMAEGLEFHQSLNTVTLVFAVLAIGLGCTTLLRKTPWWSVIASQFSLLVALLSSSWAALSAEESRWEACDPQVYYCHQMEPSSLALVQSLYPTVLTFFAVLFILNQSMKAWANVESHEEATSEIQIPLFSKSAPKLGGFPAIIGLLMSLLVAAFTHFFVVPATDENINTFGASSAQGELFESVQALNGLVLNLAMFVMVVSILTLIKKMPWWALPASILPLLSLQFMTIGESQFNGLLAFEQDGFYSGTCSLLAMLAIGLSAYRTLDEHEWDEDDDDYGGYDDVGSRNGYDFYDDDEEDNEWRGKVKTGVMACVLLLAGFGGFVAVQHVLSETDEPAFQIRDANGALSEGNLGELVVIDLLDKTKAYSEETLEVSLQINGQDPVLCSWKTDGECTFVYLEIFEDRQLTAMESILISEGGNEDWCSGAAGETCQVTVELSHVRMEEDENMDLSVKTTDLGSYTMEAA
jgi:hypothetical protein